MSTKGAKFKKRFRSCSYTSFKSQTMEFSFTESFNSIDKRGEELQCLLIELLIKVFQHGMRDSLDLAPPTSNSNTFFLKLFHIFESILEP